MDEHRGAAVAVPLGDATCLAVRPFRGDRSRG